MRSIKYKLHRVKVTRPIFAICQAKSTMLKPELVIDKRRKKTSGIYKKVEE